MILLATSLASLSPPEKHVINSTRSDKQRSRLWLEPLSSLAGSHGPDSDAGGEERWEPGTCAAGSVGTVSADVGRGRGLLCLPECEIRGGRDGWL
jgi:hypothetical protein